MPQKWECLEAVAAIAFGAAACMITGGADADFSVGENLGSGILFGRGRRARSATPEMKLS